MTLWLPEPVLFVLSKVPGPLKVCIKNIGGCPEVSDTRLLAIDPLSSLGWGLCRLGLLPTDALGSHQFGILTGQHFQLSIFFVCVCFSNKEMLRSLLLICCEWQETGF